MAVVCAAGVGWVAHWWPELTDCGIQIDDVRTHLVGYHRFEREPTLVDDPVSGACMAMQPWLVRLLYQIVTPLTGLACAAKWVQLLCVLISVAAAFIVARSPRWGLAGGALLGAFGLVFPWWIGGTPRQFGPPLLALYMAGALTRRHRVRFAAALIAAGTYPSASILMLATEGLIALIRARKEPWHLWRTRVVRATFMGAACAALALLPKPGQGALGPVITLAEAKINPDYRDGARRLDLEVSANPVSKSILEVLFEFGLIPTNPDTKERAGAVRLAASWLTLLALAWLTIRGRIRIPAAAMAFFVAGTVCYWLACLFAYRLYLPNRYSEYGMGVGGTALLMGLLVQTRVLMRRPILNRAIGNLAAAACIGALWFCWGTAERFSGSANIARDRAALYDFVASLPLDARIASHPYDGDDIPFWAGRATLCGYELDQPFFTRAWHNSVERTRAAFAALYATDRSHVISFCDQWRITHLLLRPDRYRDDFRKRAKYCDPFDAENKRRLRPIRREQIVLAEPPAAAVVFRDDRFLLVDATLLRRAWGPPPPAH